MTDETLRALLIEDSPGDVGLVRQALAIANGAFEVEHVDRLETGLERMRQRRIDVVLLGLSLPGFFGFRWYRVSAGRSAIGTDSRTQRTR